MLWCPGIEISEIELLNLFWDAGTSIPQTPVAVVENLRKQGAIFIDELNQITNLGKANWAPFFHPSGEKVIFSSNYKSERGFPFNLYMINIDGSGLEQVTYDGVFDAFPMFSYDGKKLVFSSNRNNGGTRATNLFMADWVE